METIGDDFDATDKTLHILASLEIDLNPSVQSRFRLPVLPRYLTPERRRIARRWTRKRGSAREEKKEARETI